MSEENVQPEVEEEVELEELDETETDEESIDWKERALKAEALIVKQKKQHKEEPKQEKNFTNTNSDARLDRIELRQLGYTDDVIEHIMELGGPSALKNPVLKRSADDLMAQAKAEQASSVDGGTQQAPVTKYTKDDLENMSVAELEKILPHAH